MVIDDLTFQASAQLNAVHLQLRHETRLFAWYSPFEFERSIGLPCLNFFHTSDSVYLDLQVRIMLITPLITIVLSGHKQACIGGQDQASTEESINGQSAFRRSVPLARAACIAFESDVCRLQQCQCC